MWYNLQFWTPLWRHSTVIFANIFHQIVSLVKVTWHIYVHDVTIRAICFPLETLREVIIMKHFHQHSFIIYVSPPFNLDIMFFMMELGKCRKQHAPWWLMNNLSLWVKYLHSRAQTCVWFSTISLQMINSFSLLVNYKTYDKIHTFIHIFFGFLSMSFVSGQISTQSDLTEIKTVLQLQTIV